MEAQKYAVNQQLIETVLSWVKSGEIAIPEIQRPFVWDSSKVRDLMDSLYQGYPIGYIIAWRNPNVRLKDGSMAEGKKILIDGQQRVTALRAALLGQYVVDKNYKQIKINIAFHPIEERFEVYTPVIARDKSWVANISELFNSGKNAYTTIGDYMSKNPDVDQDHVVTAISNLFNLAKKQIGMIELAADLDIETVTEIFIRINSQGVVLSQADFAMSKIAANETYGGRDLRKAIDYFCHLAVAPEYYPMIRDNDTEFVKTDLFQKMRWLKDENDDLYDPSYVDMLRVSFGMEFNRAKMSDLVSLLSGRNFETRTYEDEIAEASFATLKRGVMRFMNETDFKRFVMIIKSAGFVQPWLIRSKNALNVAYAFYLKLRDIHENPALIESYVKRWFVMTLLTGRSSGSFESQFDYDLKQVNEKGFGQHLEEIESAVLGENFWGVGLEQSLTTSVSSSVYWHVYLAAQVHSNDKGFLSKDIRVSDMIEHRGDVHHIFPKNYLKKQGLTRWRYNQIANYTYMQSEINIKVGDKPPHKYMGQMRDQCNGDSQRYGGITDYDVLLQNLATNCIPSTVFDMDIDSYEVFLEERRRKMALKIKSYYNRL